MWLNESNRQKHLVYGIPVAFLGTILMNIGCAFGMEFKDYMYGNKFDWLDLLATVIGGVIGQALQILVIYLIL
ncbi:MAG: hypothetical protein [Hatfieldvirus porci]|uniref:Lipoprotein n=1 Tax=phage Lak_Megaphage_RVC_JS4_GC31 TaxID=3109228 RepID=A0ABZ0Z1K4_9CAUD|nr:MAG: hypothetical protein [phage Lak_Megaphage_RVC_AP3_GC31]WQJ53075.1 MAG: hypothetical protein [phage Lak_Megaphage_RVC_JS4_GC31]